MSEGITGDNSSEYTIELQAKSKEANLNPFDKSYIIHVFLPTVFGATIYAFYRATDLWAYQLLIAFGFESPINHIRLLLAPTTAYLPSWFLFSLPDALWVYALTNCMIFIWQDSNSLYRYAWCSVGIILAIGSEFGQFLGIVPGTFDLIDIIGYAFAFVVVILFTAKKQWSIYVP